MRKMIPSPFHGIFSSALTATQRSASGKEPQKTHRHERNFSSSESQKDRQKVTHDRTSAGDDPHSEKTIGSSASGQSGSRTVGQVALDIFEHDSYYILKAPIAGVRLQDIDIEVNDNIITIRGTRRQADDIPADQYYLQECFWGPFERSVTLPCTIDARRVKATFNKDAVLKIIVPKEEKIKIIRIND